MPAQRPSLDEIFAEPAAQARPSLDEIFAEEPQGPSIADRVGAGIMGVGQGLTFGLADEATAGFGTGMKAIATGAIETANALGADLPSPYAGAGVGNVYESELQQQRDRMAQAAEQTPVEYYGGQVVGGIGGALATAGTAPATALANWAGRGNLALRAAKGAATGAASGAAYGFGAGEGGAENRLESAKDAALVGAVVGGAAPVVANTVGRGIRKLTDKVASKMATSSGEIVRSDLSKPLQKVYDRLRADYPDDAEFSKALNSYMSTKGQSLIEKGGKRTANLAEGAAQYPTGGAKAGEFFAAKVDEAPQKLKGSISKAVGPDVNYLDALDDVVKRGREKASPLYTEAFKRNQAVQSPLIDRILQTPEGKSALGEAVKNMQNEMSLVAKPDKELGALAKELSDIGLMDKPAGGVARGLKLRSLDYVKRAMDRTYTKAMRTGDEGEARRILNLKKALVSEMDRLDKSGLYSKARATSGDYLTARDAMESGKAFFKEDPEVVSRLYQSLGKGDREAFKVGVMKQARDIIDNTMDGRNVANMFGKETVRKKLQTILSPQEYRKLLDDAKAVDNIYRLRNQVTGNSRTALRQIAAEDFGEEGKQLISDVAKKGWRNVATDKVVSFISKRFDGLSDKLSGEVADILYETDPKKKYQIVKQLTNELNNSPSAVRRTEAGNKLRAFYSISDALTGANVDQTKTMGNVVRPLLKDESGSVGGYKPSDYERILEKQREVEGLRAAMRDPETGKIYTGSSHQKAMDNAPRDGTGIWSRLYNEWDAATDNTGFIDKNGKFISRTEAEKNWNVSTMEDARDFLRNRNTMSMRVPLTAGAAGAAAYGAGEARANQPLKITITPQRKTP